MSDTPLDRSAPGDAELVERAAKGERAAFEDLVERYHPLVDAYVRQLLLGSEDGEDLVQESFLKAFRELHTLREPERFGAWLKSIAWRECRGWVKKEQTAREHRRRLAQEPSAFRGLPTDPEPEALGGDPWLSGLARAIDDMGGSKKVVLALFYVREMPLERIAAFMNLPLGTVKRRLHDGRKDVAAATDRCAPVEAAERRRFVQTFKTLLNQELKEH